MGKLIFSELCRHIESRLFWLCIFITAGFGVVNGLEIRYNSYVDSWFFIPLTAILSVYVSIMLGTEYHSRAVNNKIICGHSRRQVCFAYFITNLSAGAVMLVLYILPVAAFGHELFLCAGERVFFRTMIIYFLIYMVWIIFNVFAVVVSSSMVIGLVVCITAAAGSFPISHNLCNLASEKEYFYVQYYDTVKMTPEEVKELKENNFDASFGYSETPDGETVFYKDVLVENKKTPNPYYVSEPFHKILNQLIYIMPHGQLNICMSDIMSVYENESDDINKSYDYRNVIDYFPLYSLADTLVLLSAGYIVFRRKELR